MAKAIESGLCGLQKVLSQMFRWGMRRNKIKYEHKNFIPKCGKKNSGAVINVSIIFCPKKLGRREKKLSKKIRVGTYLVGSADRKPQNQLCIT